MAWHHAVTQKRDGKWSFFMNYRYVLHSGFLLVSLVISTGFAMDVETMFSTPIANPFNKLTQQCITIWSLMSGLIENNQMTYQYDHSACIEALDTILCRLVRVRDIISTVTHASTSDAQRIDYIGSSLDCIESYGYDLIKKYPGSWSSVIQEQIVRAQEAYSNHIMPLITK
jgi:hypothetical protein